ncbi:hypothetical protein GQ44DRAFT_761071 [Phaeosphaeriaceae sp. PMI808]|nr:hypothetical protein GQ44DRAFT_761071 [Phaeosphaeriaceae sp. PMI808]
MATDRRSRSYLLVLHTHSLFTCIDVAVWCIATLHDLPASTLSFTIIRFVKPLSYPALRLTRFGYAYADANCCNKRELSPLRHLKFIKKLADAHSKPEWDIIATPEVNKTFNFLFPAGRESLAAAAVKVRARGHTKAKTRTTETPESSHSSTYSASFSTLDFDGSERIRSLIDVNPLLEALVRSMPGFSVDEEPFVLRDTNDFGKMSAALSDMVLPTTVQSELSMEEVNHVDDFDDPEEVNRYDRIKVFSHTGDIDMMVRFRDGTDGEGKDDEMEM